MQNPKLALLVAVLVLGAAPTRAAHWAPLGPFGGIIHDVVADPQDPQTVYVVSSGGVFRSADGGANWSPRNSGIHAFSFPDGFGHLAIDAQQPSTLYLVRSLNPDTLLKTTDAGLTWTKTSLGGLDNPRSVVVHPQAHDVVYVISFHGVSASADGGATWRSTTLSESGEVLSVAVDPVDPQVAYVTVGFGGDDGVYRTTDGGVSWQTIGVGLTAIELIAIAADAHDPGRLYVADFAAGTFYSADGGATWNTSMLPADCVYFDGLRADPSTADRVYAATCHGVFSSTDGGVTWVAATAGITLPSILAVGPASDGSVYAGTEGHGVFRSNDGGATWQARSQGLTAHTVNTFATPASNVTTMFAGTDRQGIQKTTDGGATWSRADTGVVYPGQEKVDALAVDGATATVVYAVVGGHAFKSVDGGGTFADVTTGALAGRFVRTVTLDPNDADTVYAGVDTTGPTSALTFKSNDGGASWTALPLVDAASFGIQVIAIHPTTGTIYAAGRGGSIFRSADGGASWAGSLAAAGGPFSALAIDTQTPATIYAGSLYDGLHRSLDGGVTWSRLNPDLAFETPAVVVDPNDSTRVFASSFSGVLASLDGGQSFVDVSGDIKFGLPVFEIAKLALDPANPNRILAATMGGSVQVAVLGPCASDADCANQQNRCAFATCAPAAAGADAFGCLSQGTRPCPGDECHFDGECELTTGECSNDPLPDGSPCPDEIGCTTDTCHAGLCHHDITLSTSCHEPLTRGGATLSLRPSSAGGRLAWKWGHGEVTIAADLGDPFQPFHTGYSFCVVDRGGPGGAQRVVSWGTVPAAGTCGDHPCWTPSGVDFLYRDRSGAADGVSKLRLHPGPAGKAAVLLSGSGQNLNLSAAFPLSPDVVVELKRTDFSSLCWQSRFSTARRNDARAFVAKSGGS